MKNFFLKIKNYVVLHKIISSVILLAVLFAGYWGYTKATSTSAETRYITSTVTKGSIISSVSGSGQVSALNQIDIKPSVSGTIASVNITPGAHVGNGQTLFVIDNTDAQKTIRDAEINLQNANLSLQKLKLQNSDSNLNDALAKTYDDGFTTVSNTFLDMPGIMTGLDNMFFKSDNALGQTYLYWYAEKAATDDVDKAKTYQQNFLTSYKLALKAYDDNFSTYKTTSRTSDGATIEALISKTYEMTKLTSDAIKNANNYIDFVNDSMQKHNFDIPSIIATHKASLGTYTSKTNTDLSNLLSVQTSIKSDKDAFPSSSIDTQASELTVKQRENALADAKQALSDYYVRAPFAGVIASVPVSRNDSASSGTTLATIITSSKVASISLNEVDVAKIALGEKVTLTFDAISDLTISGKVVQIDSLGAVSSGVVNYTVKISFDTDDARIKPGMSVSAQIITNIKQDILLVPNGAIKSQNGTSYVQIFTTPLATPATGVQGSPSLTPPTNQTVETGVSSDTSTEILSGLKEGDQIVTKTITSTTKTTTTPSLLNAVSGNSGRALGK